MKHYIRVKIFTERGREKYSKLDIPYTRYIRIKDIAARVIKNDGTIVDLAKNDVFEREIAKTDKIKVKAKSFAVPNIEPGVILEYRFSEVRTYGSAEDMRMVFQHDVPIQNITYYFKPFATTKYLTFNMENKFEKDKNGFYRASMENVPAIKAEPYMPPEDEVRSWLLLYYSRDEKGTSTDFWSRIGGWIARNWDIKDTLKPDKNLKAAAAQIVSGETDPDAQMRKLYEFCKTKVKNITYDTALTDEQKEDIKPNKSTSDTYKNLRGTATDINELFASLATALGYEARLAFGGDRSEKFFNPSQAHESFIHFTAISVKINGTWKYYSPGDLFVPFGMLSWKEEDTSVLLLGYKDFVTTTTPSSSPENSREDRVGRFKLLEDGTLEGTVKIKYTGHASIEKKEDNYKLSPNKREENLKDMIKAQMSTAEVSSISIENFTDPEAPFTYIYKIRIPNYAQKTGKRLFLQPGVFENGVPPVFATDSRKHDVFFRYPWSEKDDIEIELPAGFVLDAAETPASVSDSSRITNLGVKIGYDAGTHKLIYNRDFYFGGGGRTLFSVANYPVIKSYFDAFQKVDSHIINLKQQ
ncbi:MAG: DUF3857 and transglutaminase domain-containing protein [Pyrinomonadaceae bacterium]|nr:DUF3857 and transglutaminase domain-containing protein [Pyrinomonadaceae bacterium]